MGPFVPDLITDQLNLVVALLLGVGFGYVLEQAGFSSSRRLAGLFYGYDFTVLRVFFTAAVTAMSGVILLGYFGWLDTEAIFVNPTWLWPTVVGGVIMGFGFVLGGYCPGTSICAAAIGKVDAMFFVLGGLLGVFAFGEFYPLTQTFFDSSSLGAIKVFDSLSISQGTFAFLLIVMAVGAFTVTSIIEKKVSPQAAPSLAFKPWKHIAAGAGLVILGAIFIFLPDRKTDLIEKVAEVKYQQAQNAPVMDVDELAFRIVDKEPKLQIIDIRTPDEFSKIALPGSRNVVLKDFFSKESAPLFSQRHVKKVIVGNEEKDERTACGLLHELGYENFALLKGGIGSFSSAILQPVAYVPTGSRWDPDIKQFRESARTTILAMIEQGKKSGVKQVKKTKKIQGGC
jgi:rhodanese-related sulfurtransferase